MTEVKNNIKKQKLNGTPPIINMIGVGASAGGLEPFQNLVANLPGKLPETTIILAQHMSSNYKSMLVDLLQKKTDLKVSQATNGERLVANRIYTTPPDNDITIKDNTVYLHEPTGIGPKPSIDRLLKSIASEYGSKGVGIILSGTGKDGAVGMERIKQGGGITIVQNTTSSKYDGMPQAAIDTGKIDFVLNAEEIGRDIQLILEGKMEKPDPSKNDFQEVPENEFESVKTVLGLLSERTGTDFTSYKASTIFRRLEKRMSDGKFKDIDDYLAHLKDNPKEFDTLFNKLLIGVTKFNRDPEAFQEAKRILKEKLLEKLPEQNLRIWVAGCSTGEEAYTFAIVLNELMESLGKSVIIQIFATDIDQRSLAFARNGVYATEALENLDKKTISKYFIKKGTHFELVKKIRKMVLFSKHDLTCNPPFLKLDFISCRNLLIYFNQNLQDQAIPLFHYALHPDGTLFLGKSESIGSFNKLFSTINGKNKLYQKKTGEGRIIKFPYLKPINTHKPVLDEPKRRSGDLSIPEMVKETFYNSFESPYLVISESLELVQIFGNVNDYLSIKSGEASNNILKLIRQDLQIELRAVAGKAIRKSKPVKGNVRKILINDQEYFLRINAKPLLFSKSNNPLFLVIFEKFDLDESFFGNRKAMDDQANYPVLVELEHELAATKEHMNTLVEQLETSNEELQALNEELQSSNEELQASNEELETSNEELQSTNEELEIAYNEIRSATSEIERQNELIRQSENNFRTLLNNTLQAFILIDKDYKIVTFNNAAKSIYKNKFNKEVKNKQSFIDLIQPEAFEDFHINFKKALSGQIVNDEIKVRDVNGRQTILSYNYNPALDENNNKVDLVSVSFMDITAKKNAESEREKLFNLSLNLLALIDSDGIFYEVNAAWATMLSYKKQDLEGKALKKFIHPDDVDSTFEVFSDKNMIEVRGFKNRFKDKNGVYRWLIWNIIFDPDRKKYYCIAVDINDEIKQYALLKLTNKIGKIGGWELDLNSGKPYWSDEVYHLHELPTDYVLDLEKAFSYYPESARKLLRKEFDQCAEKGRSFQLELPLATATGKKIWVRVAAEAIREKGNITKMRGIIQNINERKLFERSLIAAKHEAEKLNKTKTAFLSNVSHELRTPLSGVLGLSQLVKMESKEKHILEYADLIMQSGERLLHTIDEVLDLSKVESGRVELNIRHHNVNESILMVISNLQPIADNKRLYLSTEFQKDEIKANIDEQALYHILMNLIGNALKYTSTGGVMIKSKYEQDSKNSKVRKAIIEISDTGIGISKSFMKKIFEPFTREKDVDGNGTGLGLSITKNYVDKLKGKIELTSEVGRGTTFKLSFPSKNNKTSVQQ